MTLATGSKLGPYEILAPIGAGGMGEVYRAKDTRLDRTVAVKVLPQHLSTSPEVRQRFEREAKTVSQLSHPHICALHDVGREGETDYLVMEYLEGETLVDRLGKGPLPLEQTLRYGGQIADALDKAHRQGIVHRDLKPDNVMLTKTGVKLLDFGLAKAMMAAVGTRDDPHGAAARSRDGHSLRSARPGPGEREPRQRHLARHLQRVGERDPLLPPGVERSRRPARLVRRDGAPPRDDRRVEKLTERGKLPLSLGDGEQFLFLDHGQVFLHDRRDKKSRLVAPGPAESPITAFALSRDNRWICVVRDISEGDVWMATLR